jgi:hypothetical protein
MKSASTRGRMPMSSPASQWTKLWALPLELAEAQLRLLETMTAAPLVIGARLPIIGAGALNPWTADTAELQRMVGEKASAWSRSAAILQQDMRKLASGPSSKALMSMPGDPWALSSVFLDWMRFWNVMWRMPGRSNRPIHRTVVANRKRLGKR